MKGVPQLHSVDRDGLYRSWTEGTPLHLARPADPAWYRDAHRLLREFRRRGVTHNDLAKPQNWLMTPDGRAAVIDFQLAARHRRKGALFRLMAYEDFRHLLKQQRAFAPALMTPTGRRVLARRSLPSRIWMATGKKVYNLVTRGFFRWSDGEGTHDRIDRDGPAIVAGLKSVAGVSDVALAPFPLPSKGIGIYAFVETADPAALPEDKARRRPRPAGCGVAAPRRRLAARRHPAADRHEPDDRTRRPGGRRRRRLRPLPRQSRPAASTSPIAAFPAWKPLPPRAATDLEAPRAPRSAPDRIPPCVAQKHRFDKFALRSI